MTTLDVKIEDHGYDLSDALRQETITKFGELGTYMKDLRDVKVIFSYDKEKKENTYVRASVMSEGGSIYSSASEEDAEKAMDEAHARLKTQISKEKGKELDKRDHRGKYADDRN
jgi:ribosomal subunit interface protein